MTTYLSHLLGGLSVRAAGRVLVHLLASDGLQQFNVLGREGIL
jgi:hypothetical protein